MPYTIALLRTLELEPTAPFLWSGFDTIAGERIPVVIDMRCPIEAAVQLKRIEVFQEWDVWKEVSEHEANGGLEQGIPDLTVTKKVHAKLLSDGKLFEATALVAIATHGAWSADRASSHEKNKPCREMRRGGRNSPPQILDVSGERHLPCQMCH